VLTTALSKSLQALSTGANGVIAGNPRQLQYLVSDDDRKDTQPGLLPRAALVEVVRTKGLMEARLIRGSFDKAEEARRLVEQAEQSKQIGLKTMKEAEAKTATNPAFAQEMVVGLRKMLESINLEANGTSVHGTMSLCCQAYCVGHIAFLMFGEGWPAEDLRLDEKGAPAQTQDR
jgi:hypothetical protein